MALDINELITPPSLLDAKKVLFVSPHPDDAQLGAGGTIARLISLGAEVYELTVTDDRYSIPELMGRENDGITPRQQETLDAQKCLGMKNAGFLGFHDKTPADISEISRAICAVIRELRPDFVITVDPDNSYESHSDHIKVGTAVKFACMDSECRFYPEFVNGKLRDDAYTVPNLGYYHTDKPNTFVNITDFEDIKLRSIACHASMNEPDLMASLRYAQEYYEKETGFKEVEAFRLQRYIQFHCFSLPELKKRAY